MALFNVKAPIHPFFYFVLLFPCGFTVPIAPRYLQEDRNVSSGFTKLGILFGSNAGVQVRPELSLFLLPG